MATLQPSFNLTNTCQLTSVPPIVCVTPVQTFLLPKTSLKPSTLSSIYLNSKLPKFCPKLIGATSKQRQHTTVCLFGGKGNSDNGNEASPWKALEETIGNLKKEQSIEDMLRQQMKKQEYFDDGGSGGNRPGGGGGDNSGESDEGLPGMLDELMQVILATVGFLFVYCFIIEGEEITRFAKDILKFVFSGQKSIRLRRVMDQWGSFFQRLREKKEYDPYWLEREILSTNTWWDGPSKYRYIARRQAASRYYRIT